MDGCGGGGGRGVVPLEDGVEVDGEGTLLDAADSVQQWLLNELASWTVDAGTIEVKRSMVDALVLEESNLQFLGSARFTSTFLPLILTKCSETRVETESSLSKEIKPKPRKPLPRDFFS